MSQPNASQKKTRRRRLGDRVLRALGMGPRNLSTDSNTATGANNTIAPATEAARSPRSSGNDSTLQVREMMPVLTTPEPHGGPAAVAPAPPPVVRNPAPPLSRPATPVPQAGTASDKSGVGSLWARALDSLSEKDRNTLGTNETGSNLDIEELVQAVREKREMCLENQWGFEFRGRSINLRYQADKIISWLAKFKEVGDIAIQQDPSHAALPWAGIRFLLQVGLPALYHIGC